jgi:hypothetical protein
MAMPSLTAKPLSDAELAEAEQVARRLHAELRAVVALLPAEERGASAMARALDLDRATCQRIVASLARPDVEARTLVQLPGVQGLRQFIEAVSRRTGRNAEAVLAGASAAVDRFEELIDEQAGSQRKLRERLMVRSANLAGPADGIGVEDLVVRETLFRAAAAVTGRWSDTIISLRLIRPSPGDPRKTEEAVIKGIIGQRARSDAVPLVLGFDATQRPPDADDGEGPILSTLDSKPLSGATPTALVAPFCSSPLPRVVSRSAGPRSLQVVDTPESVRDRPQDIVVANRWARPDDHPATRRPPVGEIWTLMTFPSRALVFDTYLHRDIARRCLPSVEAHLWGPDVGRQGAGRWATQFPGGPRLELLGPGLGGAASSHYGRQRDLTAHLFERMEWSPDEFVGYRCEVTFPVWRAGYCMVFDFTGNEMA